LIALPRRARALREVSPSRAGSMPEPRTPVRTSCGRASGLAAVKKVGQTGDTSEPPVRPPRAARLKLGPRAAPESAFIAGLEIDRRSGGGFGGTRGEASAWGPYGSVPDASSLRRPSRKKEPMDRFRKRSATNAWIQIRKREDRLRGNERDLQTAACQTRGSPIREAGSTQASCATGLSRTRLRYGSSRRGKRPDAAKG